MCLLKNTAQPAKRGIFVKNGNESWDVLGDSRKRYRGPWAEIGKYWPGKEPIRLQDSLPCPLKKIMMIYCFKCVTNFDRQIQGFRSNDIIVQFANCDASRNSLSTLFSEPPPPIAIWSWKDVSVWNFPWLSIYRHQFSFSQLMRHHETTESKYQR